MRIEQRTSLPTRITAYLGILLNVVLVVPLRFMGLAAPPWGVGLLLAV
ncbi:MAG: hypothetical protein M3506_04145 [Chloroflexota bacterium]|nr:hypothetical protein [Chloroflexota bacterium]